MLVSAAHGDARPRTFNGFTFTRAELDDVVDRLVEQQTPSARLAVAGLEPVRADIIPAGALVLQCVARAFGIDEFTFSEGALREGILIDTIARGQGGVLHHLRDVSRRSIAALAARSDDDPVHSQHVARLALQLYDQTGDLHGLPPDDRDYLEAAALLANVGLVISHSKHHLHSYYVIRNSDLTGLTDQEIEIIAIG
jgi:exopolyphosphatase/guanosine-5'-triphosphate,3'-diphosphate pyrophosphatase